MKGQVVIETVGSVVLKDNPLGDPRRREVPVYLPPSYPKELSRRYPVIFYLPGFGSTGRSAAQTHPWKENPIERLDRLIEQRKAPEMLLVIPDCFTLYGGSQYMDSIGTGRYEEHLCVELAPYIDSRYRTAGPKARAAAGKSSGGYGALRLAMRRSEVFPHIACHSADLLFEVGYGRDFARCVCALSRYGGSFENFLREFRKARAKDAFPHELVNCAAMAACYSPNPKSALGFDLPFDEWTGELKPEVWRRWKENDPVELAPRCRAKLRKLKTLYFDCGLKDEFFLHLGARALSRRLKALGVRHVFEEHAGGHFDTAARLDRSFALLGRVMAPQRTR
ncbi:MAG: esterase [Elusimicrobia bacterium]|nr:esterase [Elusimicrobiota bacterium]